MKKSILAIVAIATTLACSKEVQNQQQPDRNQKKEQQSQPYSTYETFSLPPEDEMADIFESFLTEDAENINGSYSINEAIWMLEGSTNYYFRKKLFGYDEVEMTAHSYDLNLVDNTVEAVDIKLVSEGLVSEIISEIGSESNALQVADVRVLDLSEGGISIEVLVYVARNISYFPTTLPTNATAGRDSYSSIDCYGNTTPNSGFDYTEKLAYNKVLNNSDIPYHLYHYGVNVVSYKDDYAYGPPNVDGSYIYNRINDIFPGNGSSACVEANEINGYRDQAYADATGLLNSGEHVFVLDMEWDAYLCGGCSSLFWRYHEIKTGDVAYHSAAPDYAAYF